MDFKFSCKCVVLNICALGECFFTALNIIDICENVVVHVLYPSKLCLHNGKVTPFCLGMDEDCYRRRQTVQGSGPAYRR